MAMITLHEFGIILMNSMVLLDNLILTGTPSLRQVARTLYQPWKILVI